MKHKFWRNDYAAFVDGEMVCVGDIELVAETLGLKVSTARFYAGANPIDYIRIESLPPLWAVFGHKGSFATEEAAELLGCAPEDVGSSAKTRRVNRASGRKPLPEVAKMLEEARARHREGVLARDEHRNDI